MASSTARRPARISAITVTVAPRRQLFSIYARRQSSGRFSRSDFDSQGFTGQYEPGQPTAGPLGGAHVGAPEVTPRSLKKHLDQYVVGQERPKKVLSVAVYNHYQRIRELDRQQAEHDELIAKRERWEMSYAHRHPVEEPEEFPGQQTTIPIMPSSAGPTSIHKTDEERRRRQWSAPDEIPPFPYPETNYDDSPLLLEKSNVLLLGPSGTGKTLLAKTLARRLDVPFSMSDCTPFTQAGYIGEDADVCVARLLAAADYDVAKAERGIICLDEIDKIATAKVSHGKDVSGEGVQQALLKIVEGTTIQVQAKGERGAGTNSAGRGGGSMGLGQTPPGGLGGGQGYPGGPASGGGMSSPMGGKTEVYNVRTDNILFIFTGAFVGLHKLIMDRISKGSIGFGAVVRPSNPESGAHETMVKGEEGLFRKHLPYYVPEPSTTRNASNGASNPFTYNTLDLTSPNDLQKYGLIPELTGRIPISCALSALDEEALVRVLTEPRNSLLHQYEHLLALSGIELRFTSAALREIAKIALDMATGARGLRTVVERLLGDAMFEGPGSHIKHILITAAVVQRKTGPIYMGRGQQNAFHAMITAEEDAWEAEQAAKAGSSPDDTNPSSPSSGPVVQSFEEYRQKVSVAGGT